MAQGKIDWGLVEKKALLGIGQRAYLRQQHNTKNPYDKKPGVIKLYENAIPIIARIYEDIGILVEPVHDDEEIIKMKTKLLTELSLARHTVPLPKLKVPNVYKIVEAHEKEVEAKYADYIRERISKPRYRKSVDLLKRVYDSWLLRHTRQKKANQKARIYSESQEADMIPVYRQEVYEEKWIGPEKVKREDCLVLSADDVRQIRTLKKWGLLHFDETRSYICFGENGKKVASILR